MKKLLVVGVIVLFLGIACAPSINANVSKDSELVDITTEICGLDGGKHTVQLTQEESEEVEQLIDDIKRQLDEVETRDETIEIFNKAIIELDKYGLLGGLSVKQAQRLITGRFFNLDTTKFTDRVNNEKNMFCLIAGNTTNTKTKGPAGIISMYFSEINLAIALTLLDAFNDFPILAILAYLFAIPFVFFYSCGVFSLIIPVRPAYLSGFILLGNGWWGWEQGFYYYPAEGKVWTDGILGKRTWETSLYGQLPGIICDLKYILNSLENRWYYPGVIGFTGLVIKSSEKPDRTFYIGSALLVNIGSNYP